MQHGCMERLNRKRGPQVWQFRWSEIDPGGKRLYHKKIIGTVEHYPDETAVRRAVIAVSYTHLDATALLAAIRVHLPVSPSSMGLSPSPHSSVYS